MSVKVFEVRLEARLPGARAPMPGTPEWKEIERGRPPRPAPPKKAPTPEEKERKIGEIIRRRARLVRKLESCRWETRDNERCLVCVYVEQEVVDGRVVRTIRRIPTVRKCEPVGEAKPVPKPPRPEIQPVPRPAPMPAPEERPAERRVEEVVREALGDWRVLAAIAAAVGLAGATVYAATH